VHSDQLDTPRVVTDRNQQIRWRWDNDDPFGGNIANGNPSGLGTFVFNLRYPGQYFDAETNQHYNYYRDYSPEIGRYVESDPIGLIAGTNTYAYVYDNSLSFTDPRGLQINWGNYVITNPWVVSNFIQLNQNIVNWGVPDKCFTLQVTGGDRYRQSRRVHRSLTDNSVVPDSAAKSPHLIERGARGIDFKIILSSAPECGCSGVTSGVVRNALRGTDFAPREMKDEQDYPGRPHIHLNLPDAAQFWNINEP